MITFAEYEFYYIFERILSIEFRILLAVKVCCIVGETVIQNFTGVKFMVKIYSSAELWHEVSIVERKIWYPGGTVTYLS